MGQCDHGGAVLPDDQQDRWLGAAQVSVVTNSKKLNIEFNLFWKMCRILITKYIQLMKKPLQGMAQAPFPLLRKLNICCPNQ